MKKCWLPRSLGSEICRRRTPGKPPAGPVSAKMQCFSTPALNVAQLPISYILATTGQTSLGQKSALVGLLWPGPRVRNYRYWRTSPHVIRQPRWRCNAHPRNHRSRVSLFPGCLWARHGGRPDRLHRRTTLRAPTTEAATILASGIMAVFRCGADSGLDNTRPHLRLPVCGSTVHPPAPESPPCPASASRRSCCSHP